MVQGVMFSPLHLRFWYCYFIIICKKKGRIYKLVSESGGEIELFFLCPKVGLVTVVIVTCPAEHAMVQQHKTAIPVQLVI